MSNSSLFGIVGVVALIAGVLLGYTFWSDNTPSEPTLQQVSTGTSAAGSSFQTAKIAEAVLIPTGAGAGATSTSILNGDSSDRFVLDAGVACTGATAAVFGTGSVGVWSFKAGTTSTANPATLSTPASGLAMNVEMATGTYDGYTATSTYTLPSARRWPTGTYMSFVTNATSSVVVECTPFVHYIAQ